MQTPTLREQKDMQLLSRKHTHTHTHTQHNTHTHTHTHTLAYTQQTKKSCAPRVPFARVVGGVEEFIHVVDAFDGDHLDLGIDAMLCTQVNDGLRGLDAANAAALDLRSCKRPQAHEEAQRREGTERVQEEKKNEAKITKM
jgi:hypothetical protein